MTYEILVGAIERRAGLYPVDTPENRAALAPWMGQRYTASNIDAAVSVIALRRLEYGCEQVAVLADSPLDTMVSRFRYSVRKATQHAVWLVDELKKRRSPVGRHQEGEDAEDHDASEGEAEPESPLEALREVVHS